MTTETAQSRIERLLAAAHHVSRPLPPPNRSCAGKRQYGRRLAHIIAADMRAQTGERLEAYACHYCPAWHVGHVMGVAA